MDTPLMIAGKKRYFEPDMNRKEFLSAMMALGGTSLFASNTTVIDRLARMDDRKPSKKGIDTSRTVLLSDIHICGEFKDGQPIKYPYNPTSLNLRVKEILSMKPLPGNVLIFGDVAWDYGLEEDYRYAASLLKPLEEAGIRVTMTLGNHDRRAPFFKVFPEYAERTPVPGRAVSVINLSHADVILLDSLAELPDLKPKQKTTVTGELSEDQIEWLKKYLSEATRPVILGAHHPPKEMSNLIKLMTDSPSVVGFIHGHNHIWNKSLVFLRPRKPDHMLPVVGLPATFYGDIGFAVMEMTSEGASISYSSKGFWWPQPSDEERPEWIQRQKDLMNEKCTIVF